MSLLFEQMAVCSEKTEHFIKKHTDSFYTRPEFENYTEYVKDLFDSFSYSIFAGGKRLRPFLVLEFCKLCGKDPSCALSYAAAIEMIHTFSLIHDDLPCMDNDDMRRGKPTNHKVFGEACALLAGDATAIYAFSAATDNNLSAEQNIKAIRLLAENAGVCGMIAGQQIDIYAENKNSGEALLTLLQNKKTGALFQAACLLGCIAAGISESDPEYKAACEFASHIGLAFQITDDILDVCGTDKELGKNTGSDVANGKTTFVSLLGLESAKSKALFELEEAKKALLVLQQKGADISLLSELCDFIYNRKN